MQCVIRPDNCNQILRQIRQSNDSVFNFSGTNFAELGHQNVMNIFAALSGKERFKLILNDCTIEMRQNDRQYVETLTLGLSTTHQIETFELKRPVTSEAMLLKIAMSLSRNHEIKSIHVDGYKPAPDSGVKVIPSEVRRVLQSHKKAELVYIDGLDALRSVSSFFQPAANQTHLDIPPLQVKAGKSSRRP